MTASWTREDDRQLWALRRSGAKWFVVAKKLNRTESAVTARVCALRKRHVNSDQLDRDDVAAPRKE
jgi:hypothetical protein